MDLISRQAAIDALGEEPLVWMEKEDEYGQGLNNQWHYDVNALKAVPSAQQWIPCSERLPRLDEVVLATTAWNDITIAWRIGIDKWFIHEGNTNATTEDLIAWMPLPEPYKGE